LTPIAGSSTLLLAAAARQIGQPGRGLSGSRTVDSSSRY
jgi:hypothetical protein